MDLIGTVHHQYFYRAEPFGDDIHYCVYRKVILVSEYGDYSYDDWVETFYDEEDAKKLVESKYKNDNSNH